MEIPSAQEPIMQTNQPLNQGTPPVKKSPNSFSKTVIFGLIIAMFFFTIGILTFTFFRKPAVKTSLTNKQNAAKNTASAISPTVTQIKSQDTANTSALKAGDSDSQIEEDMQSINQNLNALDTGISDIDKELDNDAQNITP